MSRFIITLTLHVETEADARALERAIDSLVTESAICDQFLEGEALRLGETTIAVNVLSREQPAYAVVFDVTPTRCTIASVHDTELGADEAAERLDTGINGMPAEVMRTSGSIDEGYRATHDGRGMITPAEVEAPDSEEP